MKGATPRFALTSTLVRAPSAITIGRPKQNSESLQAEAELWQRVRRATLPPSPLSRPRKSS